MAYNLIKAKNKFRNFRNKDFRENQEDAINFLLTSEKKVKVLTAPTGSGKTLLAMVAGACRDDMTYMVHSKILQEQVTTDFPEAQSLFGRANYACLRDINLDCSMCSHTEKTICQFYLHCSYRSHKAAVLAHPLRILNYDYFLTEANNVGKFSGKKFMIVDEADNLENTLIGFTSLMFTERMLRKLRMSLPSRKTATSKEGLEPWIDYVVKARIRAKDRFQKLKHDLENGRYDLNVKTMDETIKEYKSISYLLNKIDLFLTNVDDTWLFEHTDESISFRPVWITPALAEKLLWQHGQSWALLSASFPPLSVLTKQLGLDIDDVDFKEIPSTFPIERRQIYINPIANLTSKTMEEETPKLVTEIKRIMDAHPDQKGLIHTVSYSLANQIVKALKSPRIITHNGLMDKVDQLSRFMRSDDPLVMVSPSMERGVNLPDDLCRFVVVAKAPFLSLGDKVVSARVYSGKIGNIWYQSMMLLTVLQMTGRGMRSANDYCESYILDAQFQRVFDLCPSFLPGWWKDAVAW